MHRNKTGGGGGGKKAQLPKQIAEKKEMSHSLIREMSATLFLPYSPTFIFKKSIDETRDGVGSSIYIYIYNPCK